MKKNVKRGLGAAPLLPALFFLFLSIFSCSNKAQLRETRSRQLALSIDREARALVQKRAKAIDDFALSLSESERLSQLFVINLEGDKEFCFVEWLEENSLDKGGTAGPRPLVPGGYIFFSFNISRSPEQIAAFTDSVRAFAREQNVVEPFLCLDAEGGYVNRLRGVAGPLPENEWVAKNLSPEQARLLYMLNAAQLKALGFDLNLSPVVEVQNDSNKEFLDGRSFGSPRQVVQYGSAALLAYKKAGVGTVLKHFPGNNSVDPHLALPLLSYSREDFEREVLEPFGALLKALPDGVLMSHALVSIDGKDAQGQKTPASLSPYWIKDILRSRLAFDGLVFSDDIFMAALEKNSWPSERAVKAAILAGVNCILMSEKRFLNEWKIVQRLYQNDADFRAAADDSIRRVLKFKLDAGILEWSAERNSIAPSQNRQAAQERMARFYGAKKLNEEALEKYGEK